MNASQLREFCLALPGATESIQWGDARVFKVAGKMFAVSGQGADSPYSLKAESERFLELSDQRGIRPAPYLARHKWVQINPAECLLPDGDLEDLVQTSYDLVFAKLTRKLQRSVTADSSEQTG